MGCGNSKKTSAPAVAPRVEESKALVQPQGQAEVIFFLGGPGSGKGTQCQKLVETGKWVHLSTGDLLREEKKSGSKDAEMIEGYLREGKLVPSELLVGLVRKAMLANGWAKKRFLIDGYPRNEENVRVWDEKMADVKVLFLLFLECSEEVLTQRILGRNQGRSDDNPESLKKRLQVFEAETRPVLEIFRKKGRRVETVNGEGQTEDVYAQIVAKLPS